MKKLTFLVNNLFAIALRDDSPALFSLLIQKEADPLKNPDFPIQVVINARITSLFLDIEKVRTTNISLTIFEFAETMEIREEILKKSPYLRECEPMIDYLINLLNNADINFDLISLCLRYGIKSSLLMHKALLTHIIFRTRKTQTILNELRTMGCALSIHNLFPMDQKFTCLVSKWIKSNIALERAYLYKLNLHWKEVSNPNQLNANGKTALAAIFERIFKEMDTQEASYVLKQLWEDLRFYVHIFVQFFKIDPLLKGNVAGAKSGFEAALEFGDIEILNMLLPYIKDKQENLNRGLVYVVSKDHPSPQVCTFLIIHGANNFQEALDSATANEEIHKLLIRYGASPFTRSQNKTRPYLLKYCVHKSANEVVQTMQLLPTRKEIDSDVNGLGFISYFLATSFNNSDLEIDSIGQFLHNYLLHHKWEPLDILGGYLICLAYSAPLNKCLTQSEVWQKIFSKFLEILKTLPNLSFLELRQFHEHVATLLLEIKKLDSENGYPLSNAFQILFDMVGNEIIYPIPSSNLSLPADVAKQIDSIHYETEIWSMYGLVEKSSWKLPSLTADAVRAEIGLLISVFEKNGDNQTDHAKLLQQFEILLNNTKLSTIAHLKHLLSKPNHQIGKFLEHASHLIMLCKFLNSIKTRKKQIGVSPDPALREKFYLDLEKNIRTIIWFSKKQDKQKTGAVAAAAESLEYDLSSVHSFLTNIMRSIRYCTTNWSNALDQIRVTSRQYILSTQTLSEKRTLENRGLETLVALQLEMLRGNIVSNWAREKTELNMKTAFLDDPQNALLALGDEVHYERAVMQAKSKELDLPFNSTEHMLNWNKDLDEDFMTYFTAIYTIAIIETIYNAINITKEIPSMMVQEWMQANLVAEWESKEFHQKFIEVKDKSTKLLVSLEQVYHKIVQAHSNEGALKSEDFKRMLEQQIFDPLWKSLPLNDFPSLDNFKDSIKNMVLEVPYGAMKSKMSEIIQSAIQKQRESQFASTLYDPTYKFKRSMIYEMLIKMGLCKWKGADKHFKELISQGEGILKSAHEQRLRAQNQLQALITHLVAQRNNPEAN